MGDLTAAGQRMVNRIAILDWTDERLTAAMSDAIFRRDDASRAATNATQAHLEAVQLIELFSAEQARRQQGRQETLSPAAERAVAIRMNMTEWTDDDMLVLGQRVNDYIAMKNLLGQDGENKLSKKERRKVLRNAVRQADDIIVGQLLNLPF